MIKRIGVVILAALTISSCVSKKEFAKLEDINDQVTNEVNVLQKDLNDCNTVNAELRGDILAKTVPVRKTKGGGVASVCVKNWDSCGLPTRHNNPLL